MISNNTNEKTTQHNLPTGTKIYSNFIECFITVPVDVEMQKKYTDKKSKKREVQRKIRIKEKIKDEEWGIKQQGRRTVFRK